MNYPPIYHEAHADMIAGRAKAPTRQKIARSLRWLKKHCSREDFRREYRLFIFIAPGYFTA